MTIEMNGDDGEQQVESGQEIYMTPEMELALGRVLLPVFAEYLQEMGFLEADQQQKIANKDINDEMTIEETVNKIAGTQLGHAFRLSRLEDGFQQIAVAIQQLTKISSATDSRFETEMAEVNSRIETEMAEVYSRFETEMAEVNNRFETEMAEVNGRFDRMDAILERLAELQSENAGQIKSIIAAQARTDEQLRRSLDGNGSTPKPAARKAVKKAVNKDVESR